MPDYSVFRFKNHALLMALAAAYPVISYSAGAARVDFAAGNVIAVSAAGAQRSLAKGTEIGTGEVVVTGDGRCQLRFTDGAVISLQPGTEFKIDNYLYSGKGDTEEKGFFSLIKGGMRTITGLIGRSNRNNYHVTTSVATIGIRGTEYTAGISGNELLVHTGEGLVEVCNSAGCVLLGAGESGSVQGQNQPKRTDARPQLPPAQPDPSVMPVFSTGDILGGLLIPTSPMPTTGSATYSTIVNASPVTETGGVWTPGTLNSASVGVNFGSLTVSTSLAGTINSQAFTVSGSGSISGNTMSSSLSGSPGGVCGACSCTGSVSGTFYGTGASNVGINYSVNGTKTFTGTALLGK